MRDRANAGNLFLGIARARLGPSLPGLLWPLSPSVPYDRGAFSCLGYALGYLLSGVISCFSPSVRIQGRTFPISFGASWDV